MGSGNSSSKSQTEQNIFPTVLLKMEIGGLQQVSLGSGLHPDRSQPKFLFNHEISLGDNLTQNLRPVFFYEVVIERSN